LETVAHTKRSESIVEGKAGAHQIIDVSKPLFQRLVVDRSEPPAKRNEIGVELEEIIGHVLSTVNEKVLDAMNAMVELDVLNPGLGIKIISSIYRPDASREKSAERRVASVIRRALLDAVASRVCVALNYLTPRLILLFAASFLRTVAFRLRRYRSEPEPLLKLLFFRQPSVSRCS
jgi:hypothetical protein